MKLSRRNLLLMPFVALLPPLAAKAAPPKPVVKKRSLPEVMFFCDSWSDSSTRLWQNYTMAKVDLGWASFDSPYRSLHPTQENFLLNADYPRMHIINASRIAAGLWRIGDPKTTTGEPYAPTGYPVAGLYRDPTILNLKELVLEVDYLLHQQATKSMWPPSWYELMELMAPIRAQIVRA